MRTPKRRKTSCQGALSPPLARSMYLTKPSLPMAGAHRPSRFPISRSRRMTRRGRTTRGHNASEGRAPSRSSSTAPRPSPSRSLVAFHSPRATRRTSRRRTDPPRCRLQTRTGTRRTRSVRPRRGRIVFARELQREREASGLALNVPESNADGTRSAPPGGTGAGTPPTASLDSEDPEVRERLLRETEEELHRVREEKKRERAARKSREAEEKVRTMREGRWTRRVLRKGAIYHAG
jgi:hypothetical protein